MKTKTFRKLIADINKKPVQYPMSTYRQGLGQRLRYQMGQEQAAETQSNRGGFGTMPTNNQRTQAPDSPLERMYQERVSRFGRQTRKGRFNASPESSQQQIKYTQGTNALVRKQLERGEISPVTAGQRTSFMPNYYSVQRQRSQARTKGRK